MTSIPSQFARRWIAGLSFIAATCGVFAANVAPELYAPLANRTVNRGSGAVTFDLLSHVRDPDVPGRAARINFKIGTAIKPVDIAFYEAQAPISVTNFLAYINSGRTANNFIHRSVPGFVIQGGGFYWDANQSITDVPSYPPIVNETNLPNIRGTVAMARTSALNSATSQWFINLTDNRTSLNIAGDGYAVFARVLGLGMQVVDEVAACERPLYNVPAYANSVFRELPTKNAGNVIYRENTIETNMSVVPALAFSAVSSDLSLVTVAINGSTLQLTPAAANIGTATITISTTDLDGAVLQSSFTVRVLDAYALWSAERSFPNTTDAAATADPDGDGIPNLHEFAFGGDPKHPAAIAGAPRIDATGGIVFNTRRATALAYTVYTSDDLQTWTPVWTSADGFTHAAVAATVDNGGFDLVTIRVPGSSATPSRRFWKVTVTD